MRAEKLYFPEKIASHMKNRELEIEITKMAKSLNRYLKSTALYKQPEYIKTLKFHEKSLFKTASVGKKNKRKVTLFKWGTSGIKKDELIKRYGILVKATKEARRSLSNSKGIDTLHERLTEKGYNVDEKTLVKAIVSMRESGLLEYEDSERVLNGILDYIVDIGEKGFDPDIIVNEMQNYIENQAKNQAEISTKDFFNKLREEQTG